MKPLHYLEGYCHLKLHGYSHDEAKEILEEIDKKMGEENYELAEALSDAKRTR